jgi:nicotinamidase-related amidase
MLEKGSIKIEAEPYAFVFTPATCALLILDMQRDFLEPGGFGEMLGKVVHAREGHRPDLSDLSHSKKNRGWGKTSIGDRGPMGRILVRGEKGHDIIPELYPLPHEPIVDKPGKGAFYATDLQSLLVNWGITQLIITGVTTEVCVHTTLREANDRGYDCLIPSDCVASYFPQFHEMGLKMITAQGGIFGWVCNSARIIAALAKAA